jgi:adenylate kinase
MVSAIITGPTGVEKRAFLEEVIRICKERYKQEVQLCSIGDFLKEEDPSFTPQLIAENPGEFEKTYRLAFQKILKIAEKKHTVIEIHATYRYKNSLFTLKDPQLINYLKTLSPDLYVTLIDNLDTIYHRLSQRAQGEDRRAHLTRKFLANPLVLKDILVWREEEIIATQALANLTYQPVLDYSPWRKPQNYVIAREHNPEVIAQLMFESRDVVGISGKPKIYASFPVTGITLEERREVDQFKRFLKEEGIVFDPMTITEYRLILALSDALTKGMGFEDTLSIEILGEIVHFKINDLIDIRSEIEGQIISRDYLMIDQSDAVIAYISQDPLTKGPNFHFGVDGELNYAMARGKTTIVISPVPRDRFSPWIKKTTPETPLTFSEAKDWLQHSKLGLGESK